MSWDTSYSAAEKRRGRTYFSAFGLINALAFLFLTGNVITLYGLKLGASRGLLGLLGSFPYLALFFMPVGRGLVRRIGVVKVLTRSWLVRYLSLAPILFAPLMTRLGRPEAAFVSLTVCVLLFHVFRGIGMVSDGPLLGALSAGPDRGAFLARFQIVIAAASVAGGLLIVALLGREAPMWRYTTLLVVGIGLGIADVSLLSKVPEPPGTQQAAARPLVKALRGAFRSENLRRFIVAFAVFCALSGSVRAFLIVYARQVYGQPDRLAMLYTVVGSTGWVLMGFIARRVIDRLGAKPMIAFFSLVFLLSLVPMIATPQIAPAYGVEIFLGLVFFVCTMGFTGGEYASQTYFYAMVDESERLDLGMVYFLAMGAGGAVGSLFGGLLLDWLAGLYGGDVVAAYRTFFGLLAFLLVLDVMIASKLARLGARSVASALSVIFSFRDMRTLGLLGRLGRSSSIEDERKAIRRIADAGSAEAMSDLLSRLASPTFAVRLQALGAIESLPLTASAEAALEKHLTSHHFSTAYRAAEILGRRDVRRSAKALEGCLSSDDDLLVAKSMVALARLSVHDARKRLEEIMETSRNPMIVLHGVSGLHILGMSASIPALLRTLVRPDRPVSVRDEVVVALADICGFGDSFYRGYRRYLEGAETDEIIDEWLSESPESEELSATALARAVEDQESRLRLRSTILAGHEGDEWLRTLLEGLEETDISSERSGRLFVAALVIDLVRKGFLDRNAVSGYFQPRNGTEENP